MTKTLVINVDKCIACYSCVVACKDEHVDNDWSPYSKPQPRKHYWMNLALVERGEIPKLRVSYVPTPCMQCEDPPCQKAATGGAIYQRSDGIVMLDPEKSKGQRQIVDSCPYGVIYWNEELDIPQKCTMCAHLLDRGWDAPKCVKVCPVDALTFGEYEDLKTTIEQSGAEPLHPEFAAKPRVLYIGLPRTFIAGALVDGQTGECLKGADVTLKDTATGATTSTKSDGFGDFWFDRLDAKKNYEVTILAAGRTKTISVSLDTDKDLGDIQL